MASVREQILAAIVQRLETGANKPAGLTIHRYRTRPIDQDKLPAAVVYVGANPGGVGETVERMDHDDGVERTLIVRIELRIAGEPPDQVLDPLYVWTVKTLRADQTLGGLARELLERSTSFDAHAADQVYAGAAVDVAVTFATREDDPSLTP